MLSALKDYWTGFGQNDQRAIIWLTLVMTPILLFVFALKPAMNLKNDAEEQMLQTLSLNQWLKDIGPQAKGIARQSGIVESTNTDQNLSSVVIRIAQKHQLILQKFEMDNKGGLRIWFDDVRFDFFIQFISELTNEMGIIPANLAIDRQKEAGIVNVRGVLANKT